MIVRGDGCECKATGRLAAACSDPISEDLEQFDGSILEPLISGIPPVQLNAIVCAFVGGRSTAEPIRAMVGCPAGRLGAARSEDGSPRISDELVAPDEQESRPHPKRPSISSRSR